MLDYAALEWGYTRSTVLAFIYRATCFAPCITKPSNLTCTKVKMGPEV